MSVIGFRNGKNYLVRATIPKLNDSGRCECEPHGKKTFLICDSLSAATTFTTEVCDSEKAFYLLKCKVCGEVLYIGKAKTKFRYGFNNCKSKRRAFRKGNRKVPQKLFHTHYCLDGLSNIEDWNFIIFEQCETMCNWRKEKHFGNIDLKPFSR